jgi:hypothetical protein
MTQNNNFTQARRAGVNSIGQPDWIGRLGRKIQGYSGFRSAHSLSRGPRPPNSSTPISRSVAAFFVAFALVPSLGSVAYAADDSSKHFEIKVKPLADALMEFGVQSGLTVVAPTTLTTGKKGAAVRGDLAPTDALGRLLKGSGLTFGRAADGTIAIQAIVSTGPEQASARRSDLYHGGGPLGNQFLQRIARVYFEAASSKRAGVNSDVFGERHDRASL